MMARSMLEPPQILGAYRVLEWIGEGGMGVVYRAEHRETGERVAIKTVRLPQEGQLAGLRREIRALTRVRHPGVVQIVDGGVADGLPWYAMELLEGRLLGDLNRELWSPYWRPEPGSLATHTPGWRSHE